MQGIRIQKELINKILNHKPMLSTLTNSMYIDEPYISGTAM